MSHAKPTSSSTSFSAGECPLHVAMREAASTAVLQHVLYVEGECLPRSELVDSLDGWMRLHRVIVERVCPASRQRPLAPAQVPNMLETTLAECLPPVPVQLRAELLRILQRCAACTPADACPLDRQPDGKVGVP